MTTQNQNQTQKKGDFGKTRVLLNNARLAADPVLFPGRNADGTYNPQLDRATVTVIINRGQGNPTAVRITCFGIAARILSLYCMKGKQVDIEGNLTSFLRDTGEIDPNTGKTKKVNEVGVAVNGGGISLGADPMSVTDLVVKRNLGAALQGLKDKGLMAPQDNIDVIVNAISAQALLSSNKEPMRDFNPNESGATGKFGNARVWTQDRGWWDQNVAVATAQAVPNFAAIAQTGDMNAVMAAFQTLMAKMMAGTAPQPAPVAINTAEPELDEISPEIINAVAESTNGLPEVAPMVPVEPPVQAEVIAPVQEAAAGADANVENPFAR
jgi:hypothetical protein